MNKKKTVLKALALIICVFFVTVFALIESGITPTFVQNYKNNFKRNISGICNRFNIEIPISWQLYLDDMSEPQPQPSMIPAEKEEEEPRESLSYPGYEEEQIQEKEGDANLTVKSEEENSKDLPSAFSSAENTRFATYGNNIVCANETTYAKYKTNGKEIWTQKIQMQEPMLTVAGDYVLINETGGKKLSLYKDKKLLFSETTEGNIMTADLSVKGDVILVTDKEFYKGQIVVFNKNGKKIFVWDSGSYSILDASISNKRRIVMSLLSTDAGADSIIHICDVDGKEICKTQPFIDTIIFDVGFDGESVLALSDTKFMKLSQKGKIKSEFSFDGRKIKMYEKADNGDIALLFDNDGTGEIVTIKPNGKSYGPIKTQYMPDTINIKSKTIAYNNGRQAVITDYNGKKVLVADCNADIKQVHITASNRVFLVYTASIQEKKLEKKKKIEEIMPEQEQQTPASEQAQ